MAILLPWRVAATLPHGQVVAHRSVFSALLFSEQLVRPLNKLNENCRVGKRGFLAREIRLEDSTSPRTSTSDMDGYAKRHCCLKGLRQRRPAHRHHRVRDRITHQRHGLTEKKDLSVVAGFRQRVRMQKRKGGLGRVVRTPSALYQHFHVSLMTPSSVTR